VNLFAGFAGRYGKPNTAPAVAAYAALARRHGLTPTQLALGFVYNRWCVGSTIVGATTMAQLQENLAARQTRLSPDILADIGRIHLQFPNPAP
jgi:aryl-alcohol dehydrogenase-like predicted oxidoreductase